MYDKCYFCLDQLPKLKKESTASFFVNFGGAGVQKSRPTLLYFSAPKLTRSKAPSPQQLTITSASSASSSRLSSFL